MAPKPRKIGASSRKATGHSGLTVWRDNHRNVAKQSLHLLIAKPISSGLTLMVLAVAIALPAVLYIAVKNLSLIHI